MSFEGDRAMADEKEDKRTFGQRLATAAAMIFFLICFNPSFYGMQDNRLVKSVRYVFSGFFELMFWSVGFD